MALAERIKHFLINPRVLMGVFLLLAITSTIIQYLKGSAGDAYTHYNNYIIFKQSYYHLTKGENMYTAHPAEYWDLYKYPPVFALFFGLLSWMPDWMGLLCWNVLNALVLFSAINAVKILSSEQKAFALLFVTVELMTSLQNSQSNGLIAGLMIWAYNAFEGGRVGKAALFIALATFIKPFGIVAAALFLLYPIKAKFCLSLLAWCVLLAILPLFATSPATLQFQYQSWFNMLKADHAASVGYSVAGWLQAWFGSANKMGVTVTGVALFSLAYLNYKAWHEKGFKLLLLASALIWSVIFNHKAESPTFIIAVAGVALWYFSQKHSMVNLLLLLAVLIFTCLSPTDLFPAAWRTSLVIPYQLKVLPCILVWLKILWEQLSYNRRTFAVK